jgi:hypothetical protein
MPFDLFAFATQAAASSGITDMKSLLGAAQLMMQPDKLAEKIAATTKQTMEETKMLIKNIIRLYCIKIGLKYEEEVKKESTSWWGFKGILYNAACPQSDGVEALNNYKEYLIDGLVSKNIPFLDRETVTLFINEAVGSTIKGFKSNSNINTPKINVPPLVKTLLATLDATYIKQQVSGALKEYAKIGGESIKQQVNLKTKTTTGLSIKRRVFNNICKPVYLKTIDNYNKAVKQIVAEDFEWFADVINPTLEEALLEFKSHAFSNEGGSRKKTSKRKLNRNKTRKSSK